MSRIILPNEDAKSGGVGENKENDFHGMLAAMIVADVLHAAKVGGTAMAAAEQRIRMTNDLFVQTATQLWIQGFGEKLKALDTILKGMPPSEEVTGIRKLLTDWANNYRIAFETATDNYRTLAKLLKIDL